MHSTSVVAFALTAIASAAAHADPCKAIPDHGTAPAYLHPGATFSGRVSFIGDGDSLCVAVGPSPAQWVEVRVADFYAPELHDAGGEQAKATLSRLAYGRQGTCVADHQSHDRMVAVCKIGGRSVGDLMRAAGVQEGGRAFHANNTTPVTPTGVAAVRSRDLFGERSLQELRPSPRRRRRAALPRPARLQP